MHQNLSGNVPNELMREYYQQRATAGLIISEETFVSDDARGWFGAPGIYTKEQGDAWRSITDAVHDAGGRMFAQLWHQGRAIGLVLADVTFYFQH